jgi:hypothetical protein
MSDTSPNAVRPSVRAASALLGIAFLVAASLGITALGGRLWEAVTGHGAWRVAAVVAFPTVGAAALTWLFLQVAWTGDNPRIDEDENDIIPPAI